MYDYETFQAREQELHRVAAHERLVGQALLRRRQARRRAAEQERIRTEAGGLEGAARPAT